MVVFFFFLNNPQCISVGVNDVRISAIRGLMGSYHYKSDPVWVCVTVPYMLLKFLLATQSRKQIGTSLILSRSQIEIFFLNHAP